MVRFLMFLMCVLCIQPSFSLDKALLEARLKKLETVQTQLEGQLGSTEKQRKNQKRIDRVRHLLGQKSSIPRI